VTVAVQALPRCPNIATFSSGFPMNDQFIDGHYAVTPADALETHERICSVAGGDAAVTMPGQLADALGRPDNRYFTELWQKAAALMESFAGSQIFLTTNKRTAIALVNLLVTRSGYELHPPDDEHWHVTKHYRLRGCTIPDEPLRTSYGAARGEDSADGGARLNRLFDEWRRVGGRDR
jgi:prophage maintenance system killer protein